MDRETLLTTWRAGLLAASLKSWSLEEYAAARREWEEEKHPRHPKGVQEGGQFAPRYGGPTTPVQEKPRQTPPIRLTAEAPVPPELIAINRLTGEAPADWWVMAERPKPAPKLDPKHVRPWTPSPASAEALQLMQSIRKKHGAESQELRQAAADALRQAAELRQQLAKPAAGKKQKEQQAIWSQQLTAADGAAMESFRRIMQAYHAPNQEARAALAVVPADQVSKVARRLQEVAGLVTNQTTLDDKPTAQAMVQATKDWLQMVDTRAFATLKRKHGDSARQYDDEHGWDPAVDYVPYKIGMTTGPGPHGLYWTLERPSRPGWGHTVKPEAEGARKPMAYIQVASGATLRQILHHFGHYMEDANPYIAELAAQFLDKRTAGQLVRPMHEIDPSRSWLADAYGQAGEFMDPAMGVYYGKGADKKTGRLQRDGSELVALGLEQYVYNPVGLAEADPELFQLMYDIAHAHAGRMPDLRPVGPAPASGYPMDDPKAKKLWAMTPDEFRAAAERGRLREKTGLLTPREAIYLAHRKEPSPLGIGEMAGYSYDDIAYWYARQAGVWPEQLSKKQREKYEGLSKQAYDPWTAARRMLVYDAIDEGIEVPPEILKEERGWQYAASGWMGKQHRKQRAQLLRRIHAAEAPPKPAKALKEKTSIAATPAEGVTAPVVPAVAEGEKPLWDLTVAEFKDLASHGQLPKRTGPKSAAEKQYIKETNPYFQRDLERFIRRGLPREDIVRYFAETYGAVREALTPYQQGQYDRLLAEGRDPYLEAYRMLVREALDTGRVVSDATLALHPRSKLWKQLNERNRQRQAAAASASAPAANSRQPTAAPALPPNAPPGALGGLLAPARQAPPMPDRLQAIGEKPGYPRVDAMMKPPNLKVDPAYVQPYRPSLAAKKALYTLQTLQRDYLDNLRGHQARLASLAVEISDDRTVLEAMSEGKEKDLLARRLAWKEEMVGVNRNWITQDKQSRDRDAKQAVETMPRASVVQDIGRSLPAFSLFPDPEMADKANEPARAALKATQEGVIDFFHAVDARMLGVRAIRIDRADHAWDSDLGATAAGGQRAYTAPSIQFGLVEGAEPTLSWYKSRSERHAYIELPVDVTETQVAQMMGRYWRSTQPYVAAVSGQMDQEQGAPDAFDTALQRYIYDPAGLASDDPGLFLQIYDMAHGNYATMPYLHRIAASDADAPAPAGKPVWTMTLDEFKAAGQRGSHHLPTGVVFPRELAYRRQMGALASPIGLGEAAGYSYDDIARYYTRGAIHTSDPEQADRESGYAYQTMLRDAIREGKPVPKELVKGNPLLQAGLKQQRAFAEWAAETFPEDHSGKQKVKGNVPSGSAASSQQPTAAAEGRQGPPGSGAVDPVSRLRAATYVDSSTRSGNLDAGAVATMRQQDPAAVAWFAADRPPDQLWIKGYRAQAKVRVVEGALKGMLTDLAEMARDPKTVWGYGVEGVHEGFREWVSKKEAAGWIEQQFGSHYKYTAEKAKDRAFPQRPAGPVSRYDDLDWKDQPAVVAAYMQEHGIEVPFGPSKLNYEHANEFIATWHHSSNDEDMRSLGLQKNVAALFGQQLSPWQQSRIAEREQVRLEQLAAQDQGRRMEDKQRYIFERPIPDPSVEGGYRYTAATGEQAQEALRRTLQDLYNRTQEHLQALPGDTLRLYRGIRLNVTGQAPYQSGEVTDLTQNAVESWTVNYHIAEKYAHRRLKGVTPPFFAQGVVVAMDVPKERILATPDTGHGCLHEWEVLVLGGQSVPDEGLLVYTSDVVDETADSGWKKH